MLKTISTFCTANNMCFLTPRIAPVPKIISRTFSDQGIEVSGKWDLLSAVCLERHPVITKPLQDIERRQLNMLQQIEILNSVESDYETRKKRVAKRKEKAGGTTDVASTEAILDMEHSWQEELTNFKFAPRTNEMEDDKLASLKRKLDKNLILLVEQKVGNTNFWMPPQCIRQHSETMIQTAHRSLQDLCGDNIKVKFYGNAPIGFYRYTYPRNVQKEGREGAKIFFFLAKYVSGNISPNVKHCWLDRKELQATTHPALHKSLSKFLLPE